MWREIHTLLMASRCEADAEAIGRGQLSRLLSSDPQWVHIATSVAQQDPRMACALAYSAVGSEIYRLLGRVAVASAYVRFAQPDEPGWWDGWAAGVIDGVMHDEPTEFVDLLFELVEQSPRPEVLDQIAVDFMGEFFTEVRERELARIEGEAARRPGLRRVLRSGLALSGPSMNEGLYDRLMQAATD